MLRETQNSHGGIRTLFKYQPTVAYVQIVQIYFVHYSVGKRWSSTSEFVHKHEVQELALPDVQCRF
jgi:Na+-transporting NADH:ubiquinone oxidoreductase subunit NqrB